MNIGDKAYKDVLIEVLENGIIDKNPRPYWLEEDGIHL